MKATTEEFTPFQLTITIESKRELEFLLSVTNGSDSSISEYANEHRPSNRTIASFRHDEVSLFKVYESLEGKLKKS